MKKILSLLLLLPVLAMAQTSNSTKVVTYGELKEKGISFDQSPNWKEVVAKAKAENKYIFVDYYTTWCGPCKYMDENIYPLPEVGKVFNAKFINVKIQLDSTGADNDYVKGWREDGRMLEKKYSIAAYPSYMIFDPNGNAVHRLVGGVGSVGEAKSFITRVENAFIPEKQYYTQLAKYESGNKDPQFLRDMAKLAGDAYDQKNAQAIADEYINTQTDLLTKENLEFLLNFSSSSKSKGFATLLQNLDKAAAVLGEEKLKGRMRVVIINEEMWPAMSKINRDKATVIPDYTTIVDAAIQKYPQFTKEINEFAGQQKKSFVLGKELAPGIRKINGDKAIVKPDYTALVEDALKKYPGFEADIKDYADKQKIAFYLNKKEWTGFKEEMAGYITKYGEDKMSAAELNSYAWAVFENCKDMTCVTEALDWSKKSFAKKDNPMFMDTYANILHKLGKTKEAIEWQKKAIALLDNEGQKKQYEETLAKMEKGEKTWKD